MFNTATLKKTSGLLKGNKKKKKKKQKKKKKRNKYILKHSLLKFKFKRRMLFFNVCLRLHVRSVKDFNNLSQVLSKIENFAWSSKGDISLFRKHYVIYMVICDF